MRRAGRLALAIGLALTQRAAMAGDAFEAILVGSNEVPGPGMEEGSVAAVLAVEGTSVTLKLTPLGVRGRMSAHLHRGFAGVAGRLVAEFPWSPEGDRRTLVATVSLAVAASLAAHPERYYLDVHTEVYPAGAARGQLARRTSAEAPPDPGSAATAGNDVPAAPAAAVSMPPPPRPLEDYAEGRFVAPAVRSAPRQAPDPDSRIPKKSQRIVGAAPEFKTYTDPDFRPDVSATSGLDIVYFAWGDCTVAGSSVHITGAGWCELEAHQPGDSNYLAARIVDLKFPILRADQTIDFPEIPSPYYGPYDLPLYARASSGLPVAFTASSPCAAAGSVLQILGSGTCSVTAVQPGDRNFNAAPSVTRSVEVILPAPPPP